MVRCVCFASVARRLKVSLDDGMQVVVTGRLDFYDAQGHVQIYVDQIERVGVGVLEQQFRQLCDQLRGRGYFEPDRKRPLPQVPQGIAVVTSRNAAALQDVIDTARRRWPGCRLLHYDVRVQGKHAAPEIATAITAICEHAEELQIDAVIVTRGGGSIEDLWAFNEPIVADAIYHAQVPIVAAIGHETDTTIAELVADARYATPTQATMAVVPEAAALFMQVHQYAQRLTAMIKRQIEASWHRLDAVGRHGLFRRPRGLAESTRTQLANLAERLDRTVHDRMRADNQRLSESHHRLVALAPGSRLARAQGQMEQHGRYLARAMRRRVQLTESALDGLRRQLEAIGPQSVLGRGFTYTLGHDGKVIRSIRQIAAADRVTTVLADGRFTSTVRGRPTANPTRKVKASNPADPGPVIDSDQFHLFDNLDKQQ